jgi:hypothetical protein
MIQYSHGATSEWREHTLISHIDERQTETESVRERNMSDCAIEYGAGDRERESV